MKNITNKSIEKDYEIIQSLASKYINAIWENQEGQEAHFDCQQKNVKLAMMNCYNGLSLATEALKKLMDIKVKEDVMKDIRM